MAFDKPTRNLLANFVSDARRLLTEEFTRQMQAIYGMNPETGEVAPLEALTALTNFQRATAQILRDTLAYYLASAPKADARARRDALDRIVREQAFTVLNRLAAVRMAEARGLIIESIAKGYQSEGFRLYDRLAGPALGGTGDAYRAYLFSLFDEFAVDLPVLFDRFSPEGRLFPRENALLALLDMMNAPEIAPLWAEDETIGWIYQYFNSVEERRRMRKESQAPRNSRELAVRNQFFTPRYVVEFLTDNTLGRIWYEMTQGETGLAASCRYLVRRPLEIFLNPISLEDVLPPDPQRDERKQESAWWMTLPEEPHWALFARVAEALPGPRVASQLFGEGATDVDAWLEEARERYGQTGRWEGDSARLWLLMWAWTRRLQTRGQAPDVHAWAEMQALYHAWQEALAREAEETDQETLLCQPVYIPHRALKDPRDILMLDPACGSMHFGLYAFDLYEQMYREAWDLEARLGPDALARPEDLRPLHETFTDQETFLKAIPKLIVERNIHGIDIDPRAVQIAGLSLWLRAQRSWHEMGVKALDRPPITKSNIVCAEPMPGDEALLEEFIAKLENPVLGDLMRTIVDKMKLAGEAGSLLKIEEEIALAVEKAKEKYENRTLFDQDDDLDLIHFWEDAEARLLDALRAYAEQAENGGGFRRRLFAQDAAQGLAFIDVSQKFYDVVLMNPPFGEATNQTKEYIEAMIPYWGKNLAAAFIGRLVPKLSEYGKMASVMDRTILIKSSYEEFRQNYALGQLQIGPAIDLGWNVLDGANVEVSIAIFELHKRSQHPALFLDIREKENKHQELDYLFQSKTPFGKWIKSDYFLNLPNTAITFDIPSFIVRWFSLYPSLQDAGAKALQGHAIKMDWYSRAWWEIETADLVKKEYVRMYNGGGFSRFFTNIVDVVQWKQDGKFLRLHPSTRWSNADYQQLPGIGYGKRGDVVDAHIVPAGHIFTVEGLFILPSRLKDVWYYLGMLNAPLISVILNYYTGQHKHAGYVNLLPLPKLDDSNLQKTKVESLAREGYEIKRQLSTICEISPHFISPFITKSLEDNVFAAYEKWHSTNSERIEQVITLLEETVELIYSLSRSQKTEIQNQISKALATSDVSLQFSLSDYSSRLLSYLLGVVWGRWDIRLIFRHQEAENLPNPLEYLPPCPPGMLKNKWGLPARKNEVPADYPVTIVWDGILVEESGHPLDIVSQIRHSVQTIWKKSADSLEQNITGTLGINSLREYFTDPNGFFDAHIKHYSKNRGFAPIYWPLSTPFGSYTLWLYYHRLNDQILYTAVNDFVEPKLKEVSREVRHLRGISHRTREQEKDLERLTDLEMELIEFKDELLRIAAFWKPNLNDGVQITAAPLWKLFRHRKWRERLQETWEKLEAGDYDWAHLAMSIWPERVAPKCRQDRSLAIAHDLDDLFWVEEEGKGRPLQAPAEEIKRQRQRQRTPVREEVRAALEALASGRARGLSARAVWEKLSSGEWDDTLLALRLWPERVAKKVWADRNLAQKLKVAIPEKRRKNPTRKFIKDLADAGEPALAELLARALAEEDAPFEQVWAELATGQRDDQPLALALWPDRVIDKCLEDVQLAQAHGLAPYFWTKHPAGVWRRRKTPDEEIRDEIKRRKKQ